MRIALAATSYWPLIGGTQQYVRQVARAITTAGHSVTVITRFTRTDPGNRYLTSSESPRRYRAEGVEVEVLGAGPFGRLCLRASHRLQFYERTHRIAESCFTAALGAGMTRAAKGAELIHYSGVGREMLGFIASRVATRMRVPIVVTPHLHLGSWGDGALDVALYRRATRLLAHTRSEKDFLVGSGVSADSVDVIGNPVETLGSGDGERFRGRHRIHGPMVLFVGRQANYKGFGLLLDAAPGVWRALPDTRFVFIGPADEGCPLTPGQRATLSEPRVTNLSVVDDAQKEDAYAACDVFCLPSEAESFGIVYVEAWRYCKPVIAMDIPSVRDLVGGCGGGRLTSRREGQLAADLLVLLQNPGLRNEMGKRGLDCSNLYAPATVASRISESYRRAADGDLGPLPDETKFARRAKFF
jgi:phosphatidylinositol alpha-1,6-mannosyltransferase